MELSLFNLVLFLVSYVLVTFIQFQLDGNTDLILKWWSNNNGHKYDDILNIDKILMANWNYVLYFMSSFASKPSSDLNLDQIRFINKYLFKYIRSVPEPTVPQLFLLPRHFCEDVRLSTADNDKWFTEWLVKSGLKEGNKLEFTFTDTETTDGITIRTYTKKSEGVYPSADTPEQWGGMIMEWLGSDWQMTYDEDRQLWNPTPKKNANANYDQWFSRPDNFFGRMRIFPNSPLISYPINNKYSVDGVKVDSQAMQNLFKGGWIAFLLGQSRASSDDFSNIIKTDINFQPTQDPKEKVGGCKKKSDGDTTVSVLTSMAPFFMYLGPTAWASGKLAMFGLAVGAGGLGAMVGSHDKCVF